MLGKKHYKKLAPRGRKARFAEFTGRTQTAVGQWAKGRFHSPYLEQKLREWDPNASNGVSEPAEQPEQMAAAPASAA